MTTLPHSQRCPAVRFWSFGSIQPGHALLLSLLVASPFVPAGALTLAMLAALVIMLADPLGAPGSRMFSGMGYFTAIVLAGLLGAPGKPPYDVAKDLWYVCNPLLTLVVGRQIARGSGDLAALLRICVIAAFLVAVQHVCRFLLHPSYLIESAEDIRRQIGAGHLVTALGLGIVLNSARHRVQLFTSHLLTMVMATFCLASVILSFSRTLWLAVLTFVITVLVIGKLRIALRIGCVAACAVVIALAASDDWRSPATEPGGRFLEKTVYSLRELQVADYEAAEDINRHWRGFESYRALLAYAAGSPLQRLIGSGFGTGIDLGFVMTLADEEFDTIPILHNGYLYLLVKTGAIGLAAYLLYLLSTMRTAVRLFRLPAASARLCGFMLAAITLIMLECTMVVAGMFNKDWVYPATLLLGMLTGHAESLPARDESGILPLTQREGNP